MTWTQAICAECYEAANPGRRPVALRDPDTERCCECGVLTNSGIYVRRDPTTVPYPRKADDE